MVFLDFLIISQIDKYFTNVFAYSALLCLSKKNMTYFTKYLALIFAILAYFAPNVLTFEAVIQTL